MSPLRHRAAVLLAVALTYASPAVAQQQSRSATVAMSLRVLPQASFDGGAGDRVSAAVEPGDPARIDPVSGGRTRMTFNAATQVVVSGSPLRGPGGASVHVRFVCAFGGGMSVSAAEPFDCVNGLVAELEGARTTSIPLAVGVELSGLDTRDLPPGLYTGRVTLTATNPAY